MKWQRVLACLLGAGLGWALHAVAEAEILKYVDDKGVTYFSNQPPENPAPQPAARASAPRPAASASASASAPVPAVPASQPANPAKALGDWPPKPMKGR